MCKLPSPYGVLKNFSMETDEDQTKAQKDGKGKEKALVSCHLILYAVKLH